MPQISPMNWINISAIVMLTIFTLNLMLSNQSNNTMNENKLIIINLNNWIW